MDVTLTLIEAVKDKCYITDDSTATERRLNRLITNIGTKTKRLLGVSSDFDFEEEGNEEELDLFLNYCWYEWNDAGNEFKTNYLDDINSLRNKYKVAYYANKAEEEEQF